MNSSKIWIFIARILALGHTSDNTGKDEIRTLFQAHNHNWKEFMRIAEKNYVLQALYLKSVKHNLDDYIPGDIISELKEQFENNLNRNNIILDHTRRINTLLKSNNIDPVFMKGLGNMLDGLYSSPGERMMLDIDILTDPADMEKAARLLIDDGFTSAQMYDPERKSSMKNFPELVTEGLPAFVDIHQVPVNIQYKKQFNYKTAFRETRPSIDDPAFRVFSDAYKIRLNFIHSQLVHWGDKHAHPSLRDLYDLLLLSEREDPAGVFSTFTPYRSKAAGYLRVLYNTFGLEKQLPGKIEKKGRLHLLQHKITMRSPATGKIIFALRKTCMLCLVIPFRSIFNKNYRHYITVRLKDPEWYRRNLGVRKFAKKK